MDRVDYFLDLMALAYRNKVHGPKWDRIQERYDRDSRKPENVLQAYQTACDAVRAIALEKQQ